jgi:hypothetical protein
LFKQTPALLFATQRRLFKRPPALMFASQRRLFKRPPALLFASRGRAAWAWAYTSSLADLLKRYQSRPRQRRPHFSVLLVVLLFPVECSAR